jgi:hypothetical protein
MNITILIYAIIILLTIAVMAALWFTGHKNTVIKLAEMGVEQAEKWFGDGKGKEQFHFVYTLLQPKIPDYMRWYFTEDRVRNIINDTVQKLKVKLGSAAGINNPGLLRIEQAKIIDIFATKAATGLVANFSDPGLQNVAQLGLDAIKSDINKEIFANVKLQTNFKGDTGLQAGAGAKVTW